MRDEQGRRRTLALAGGSTLLLVATLLIPLLRTTRGSRVSDGEHENSKTGAIEGAATPTTEPTSALPSESPERRPVTDESEENAGPRLRLRVLDAFDYRPVAGARATFFGRAEPTTRRTDGEGRCEFPVADPPAENLLLVEKAGYLAFRRKAPWEGSESITIERVATLHARILAADTEEGLAGAWVEFVPPDCDDCPPVRVAADVQGRVEVAPLAFGRTLMLTAGAEGFATRQFVFSLPPEGATDPIEHEIHLPRGVRVIGRVRDFTSGAPLVGACVGPRAGGLLTDADGRFDGPLQPEPGGAELVFDVHAVDHIFLIVRASVAELPSELELRLPGLAWIEGEVLDDAGQPVARSQVFFQAGEPARDEQGNLLESTPLYELPAGLQPWAGPVTMTTEEGRYRLGVLPWALNGSLSVSAREHESVELPWSRTGAPGSVQSATFRLARSSALPTIHGQLFLNGEPVPLSGELRWRGPTRAGSVTHDPEEGFEVVVEPGTIEVEAEFAAFPGLRSLPLSVQLGPHSSRVIYPDVRVQEQVISGTVRDTSGAAFSGAEVWATCPWPGPVRSDGFSYSRFTRSDSDGSYQLSVVDFGSSFRLQCFTGGAEVVREGVTAGASGVDFVMQRGRSLYVRVRDERTGAVLDPERDFALLLSAGDAGYEEKPPLSDDPDPSGYHEYALPEEQVDLLVLPEAALARELAPWIRSGVTRQGDDPVRVEVLLRRGVTQELMLIGDPLPAGHELYLVEESLGDSIHRSPDESPLDAFKARRKVNFDERGHARIEALASGPVRFRLFPDDLYVTPASFRLDPGQPPVEVQWSRR